VETLLLQSTSLTAPRAAPDGGKVFYRTLAGPPPQRQAIHAVNIVSGAMEVACDDCGTPTSVSPQSAFVAFETGSRIPRIAVLDTRTRTKQDILSHPHHGALSARISPDGQRIAFELDKGVDGRSIYVAPFRGKQPIAEQEWMEISSGGFNCEPAWSPDGAWVYFLSDRKGSRNLWRRRVLPGHQPEGAPGLVFSFPDAALTPIAYSQRNTRIIGLAIGPGRAILTLSELRSDLQVVQIAGEPAK
jgi:Tol biopolymer transport system component